MPKGFNFFSDLNAQKYGPEKAILTEWNKRKHLKPVMYNL